MLAYSETAACRMRALVAYFGDTTDSRAKCGICDVCAPAAAIAQEFRPAGQIDLERSSLILGALRKMDSTGAGRLYTTVFPSGTPARRTFEDLLGAMARAGLVDLVDASFEKDGKRIDFRRVSITALGRDEGANVELMIPVEESAPRRRTSRLARKKKTASKKVAAPMKKAAPQPAAPADDGSALAASLKAWRLSEAKTRGIPAFRILTDRTLMAIVEERPQTTRELLAIPGMGLPAVEKYGAKIFRIIAQSG
jgi:superfamily II DNA helicase RecQ